MHPEEWQSRLERHRLEIARLAGEAEHTEATVESERETLENVRAIGELIGVLVEATRTLPEAYPTVPVPDLAEFARQLDLGRGIDGRLATLVEPLPPPRIGDLSDPEERERLPYLLEAVAAAHELQAAAMRTAAAMVRVRAALPNDDGEAR